MGTESWHSCNVSLSLTLPHCFTVAACFGAIHIKLYRKTAEPHDEKELREDGAKWQDAANRAPETKDEGQRVDETSQQRVALRPGREERLHKPGLCRDLPPQHVTLNHAGAAGHHGGARRAAMC